MHVVLHSSAGLLMLSIGIAYMGAYMTACFCCQFRLCSQKLTNFQSKVLDNNGLFMLLSFALGGVAIFSLNVVALSGVSVTVTDGTVLPMEFQMFPLMMALITSILTALFVGLSIASRDKMFAKTKQEIVELYVEDAKKMSLKAIKNISATKMIFIIATRSLHYLIAGGIVTGTGAAATMLMVVWSMKVDKSDVSYEAGHLH